MYLHDPDREDAAIERLQGGAKLLFFVLWPLAAGVIATPLSIFGPGGLVIGAVLGLFVGLFATNILAAVLEWMCLQLIATSAHARRGRSEERTEQRGREE
jgi:hypothetical protein